MRKSILALILDLGLLTFITAFTCSPPIVTDDEAMLHIPKSVSLPQSYSTELLAVPTPTFVPNVAPISFVLLTNQITPTVIPTSAFGEPTPEVPIRTAPPLWLTLSLLGICCVMLLIIGLIVLAVTVRNQNVKDANIDQ